MGIIKKYKIIYERNIIISNLIFKANRGKKNILYLLSSSRRKLCSCKESCHFSPSLGEENFKFA